MFFKGEESLRIPCFLPELSLRKPEKMITKTVKLGGKGITKTVLIGGGNPVSVQTMWKDGITDLNTNNKKLESIIKQLNELSLIGCDIVRFAVPDMESAACLNLLSERTVMPLVADIHFDYKLALECLKANVAAIRINPGDRKSTRLNSSHIATSRMPSSA